MRMAMMAMTTSNSISVKPGFGNRRVQRMDRSSGTGNEVQENSKSSATAVLLVTSCLKVQRAHIRRLEDNPCGLGEVQAREQVLLPVEYLIVHASGVNEKKEKTVRMSENL